MTPSEQAVEAVLDSREPMVDWQRREFRPTVVSDLQAAEPVIREEALREFKEKLLFELRFELGPYSIEEVEAALSRLGEA